MNLTRGTHTFNPAVVLNTYLGMRAPLGNERLMMKAKSSVSYTVYGSKPAIKRRFNLHDPSEKCCFMPNNVMGVNAVRNMCPTLAIILGLERCTNGQLRSTAIQALRMASFTVEEVAGVSRHVRPATITRHYDPGLRNSMKANMAVAIAQAPALKRGNQFVPIDEYLPRKVSKSTIEFAPPEEMLPTRTVSRDQSGGHSLDQQQQNQNSIRDNIQERAGQEVFSLRERVGVEVTNNISHLNHTITSQYQKKDVVSQGCGNYSHVSGIIPPQCKSLWRNEIPGVVELSEVMVDVVDPESVFLPYDLGQTIAGDEESPGPVESNVNRFVFLFQ